MKTKWKQLTISLACILALTPAIPLPVRAATAAPNMQAYYPTDTKGHWAEQTLTNLIQARILGGNSSEGRPNLRPNDSITRAEFLAVLLRATGEPTTNSTVTSFTDVRPGDWFAGTVATAVSKGIANGVGGGRFAPNDPIRRGEITALLVRYFRNHISFQGTSPTFTDVPGHWASDYITQLSQAAIVNGYGDVFRPNAYASRAEAATMINRALNKEQLHVPSDKELMDVVSNDLHEGIALLNGIQFEDLDDASFANETGFFRDASLLSHAGLSAALKAEAAKDLQVSIDGTPVLKVTQKSERYAQVEMTGVAIKLSFVTSDGEPVTTSEPVNDHYFLRKVADGWKIYGAANVYAEIGRLVDPVSFFSSQKLAFAAVKDAVVSPLKPVIYFLDESTNRLVSLNYQTGESREAPLRNHGEKLAVVPGTGEVVVAETVRDHSSYWYDQDQSGSVEVFDGQTLALKSAMNVQTDPYDIAVDSKGFVYISSGSGQWTKLSSYSLKTKSLVDSRQIRQQSRIVLSPDETKLYTVDSDSSPRDMAAYLVKDGKFTDTYDSPYHGDYVMGTVNWLSPDGKLILNSAGTVFQTATGRTGDMKYLANLNNSFKAFAAYDGLFYAAEGNLVRVYQADQLNQVGSFKAAGSILNIWNRDRELVVLIQGVPEGSNRPQNLLQIIQL